jgi:hypothetical protein
MITNIQSRWDCYSSLWDCIIYFLKSKAPKYIMQHTRRKMIFPNVDDMQKIKKNHFTSFSPRFQRKKRTLTKNHHTWVWLWAWVNRLSLAVLIHSNLMAATKFSTILLVTIFLPHRPSRVLGELVCAAMSNSAWLL